MAKVNILLNIDFSDRIRTTNNMLGDCYAAAVVEKLSKKELMALDASAPYLDNSTATSNGNCLVNDHQTEMRGSTQDFVDVEMNLPRNGNCKQ